MSLTPEVQENLLTVVVQMALDSAREEADLLTIARRLGELGELKLMTDLYAHVERMQTCLGLGESVKKAEG